MSVDVILEEAVASLVEKSASLIVPWRRWSVGLRVARWTEPRIQRVETVDQHSLPALFHFRNNPRQALDRVVPQDLAPLLGQRENGRAAVAPNGS